MAGLSDAEIIVSCAQSASRTGVGVGRSRFKHVTWGDVGSVGSFRF